MAEKGPTSLLLLTHTWLTLISQLAQRYRFFHWEIEFPDVFASPQSGFDAVVGNPPWEIQKPNSMEYFSNRDPLYRTYGKQEALQKQRDLFESDAVQEQSWLEYNARFKSLSNWCKNTGSPYGDGSHDGVHFSFGRTHAGLHPLWSQQRKQAKGYADAEHPFVHQGSADINTYKLFLETSHALLCNGGQLGMIVPSGLYSDKGSSSLRDLFINRCRIRFLYSFQNERFVFQQIHHAFKMVFLFVWKFGETDAFPTRFRLGIADSPDIQEIAADALSVGGAALSSRALIDRFSPKTRAILEIREKRDLEILEKIYANSVLLGDDTPDGWGIKYATEFHMTNDSKLFPPRPHWEAKGYKPDPYGRWIGPDGDVALPVYEGRMIGQFDFSNKGWVSGKGRVALWRELSWEQKEIEPQYLMSRTDYRDRVEPEADLPKICLMDVTAATNTRTTHVTPLVRVPCGHSAPVLSVQNGGLVGTLALSSILNSFVYDMTIRTRIGGLHLTLNYLEETPLPSIGGNPANGLACIAARLSLPSSIFSPEWMCLKQQLSGCWLSFHSWKGNWAISQQERLRLRSVADAIVGLCYGLSFDDFCWLLRECDYPFQSLQEKSFRRQLDSKGFWRVDASHDPELRLPVLSLVALRDLEETVGDHRGDVNAAIGAFFAQNNGEGWQLPETLRLADYGLGHDERAKQPQPVRERLGPRFLPWQLEQSVEESWAECEQHARNILGEEGFARLQEEIRSGSDAARTGRNDRGQTSDVGTGQLKMRFE